MALKFLLDTNVVSEWVKQQPDAGVLSEMHRHEGACAVAAPTLEELAFGLSRLPPGRRRDQLEQWLTALAQRLPVLPYDAKAAWWWGVERARLARIARPVPRPDGSIAAVAATHGLTLVTRNLKDFQPMSGFEMVSWHSSQG